MPIPQLPGSLDSLDNIKNYIMRLERELRFLMESGLDSTNAFEFGGWRVGNDQLASKDNDVGMSTADTVADDVRFFAGPSGDVWFYYVTKSGKLYATDAFITGLITGSTIIGGVIKTAETGARIELSGGVLKGYSASNNLHGLVFNPSTTSNFFDLFFYHDGVKYAELYDDGIFFKLRPTVSTGLGIGGPAGPIRASNEWLFSGNATFDNDISGKISEAYFADHAATASAADELSPSGEIAWAQVLKGGSTIADIATRNISDLTEDSGHRTSSDTEKATWNAKANATQPAWTSMTPLLNSWANADTTVYNAAGYYKDTLGVVWMRGLVSGGVTTGGTVIYTLPVGSRPGPAGELKPIISYNGTTLITGYVIIRANGNVEVWNVSNTFLALSGITFRAES